jgi:sulfatase maturation enzyme AslB (radical SAM superfamily)
VLFFRYRISKVLSNTMECKFIKHGIALSYDQVVKPCCAWKTTTAWKKENHISQIDLSNWHVSPQVVEIEKMLANDQWPEACGKCERVESDGRGDSIRGGGNSAYANYNGQDLTLEIRPGSVCNFACQTCWPEASSRVAEFQSRAGLIDIKSIDSTSFDNFDNLLPIAGRLKDVVLLGGEPFYDKSCLKFLSWAKNHLTAHITMFTNASKIDFDFLQSYPGKLTLVFSLDAVGRPAEYIRYGTNWDQVVKNYLAVKQLPNVNVRVNITCSVYNYLYIKEVIELLVQDWPSVVTFGVPHTNYLGESAIPFDRRESMVISLEQAIDMILKTDIESGQKSNAVNALAAHVTNLKTKQCSDIDYQQLCMFIDRMDAVKNIKLADYCPELSAILE